MLENEANSVGGTGRTVARKARRADVQGLRAVAVVAVVLFHAGLALPGGFVGVDVFFVISGFVITRMLMREWGERGSINLGRFYWRRFRRLSPALALVLLFTVVVSIFVMAPLAAQDATLKTALGALFFVGNFAIAYTSGGYFDGPAEHNPLLHTWSLGVEEQFYFVFPLALVICWSIARRWGTRWVPPVLVLLASVLSFALAVFGAQGGEIPGVPSALIGFYSPVSRAWEFGAGVLLAMAPTALLVGRRRWASVLGVVGAAAVLLSFWLIEPGMTFPGFWTLLPVVGTVLVIAAGEESNVVSRVLSARPMVAVGDWSYSIYLWHWPLIVFATLLWPGVAVAPVIAAALCIVPAVWSFRRLERPLQTVHLGPRRAIALVGLVFVPTGVVAVGTAYAVENSYWNDAVASSREAITSHHLAKESGCWKESWLQGDACVWNGEATGTPIYLLGDSNADHFSEAVVEAGEAAGRPVHLLTENACSFLTAEVVHSDSYLKRACPRYMAALNDLLPELEPGTVVVANSYGWWNADDDSAVAPVGGAFVRDPDARWALLPSLLDATVTAISEAGHEPVLVQPIPHWGSTQDDLTWDTCSVFDFAAQRCNREMSLEEAIGRHARVRGSVAAVAQEHGVAVVDVATEICPDGTCFARGDEGELYMDGTHLSVRSTSRTLDSFRELLER